MYFTYYSMHQEASCGTMILDTNRSASSLPHKALKGFVILGPTGPTNSGRLLWF